MFVRTNRLLLRPGWTEDAAALHSAIAHPQVIRMLSRVPLPYTLDDAHDYLSRPVDTATPRFVIMAHEGGTTRLVGAISVERFDGATPELAYWLTPSAWGRGYATEAGQAVIDIARDGLRLPRLAARHFTNNLGSRRVLRKLGFRATHRVEPLMSLGRGEAAPAALMELDLSNEDTARLAA